MSTWAAQSEVCHISSQLYTASKTIFFLFFKTRYYQQNILCILFLLCSWYYAIKWNNYYIFEVRKDVYCSKNQVAFSLYSSVRNILHTIFVSTSTVSNTVLKYTDRSQSREAIKQCDLKHTVEDIFKILYQKVKCFISSNTSTRRGFHIENMEKKS